MPHSRVDQAMQDMPVLVGAYKDVIKQKPLKKMQVLICSHITKETAVLGFAYRSAGAKVYVIASNPDTIQPDIVLWLRSNGITCPSKRGESMAEYQKHIDEAILWEPHVVIDDGGDVTARLHELKKTKEIRWIQEETTTGITRARALQNVNKLNIPVININDAPTKHLFDNVHGTGQSAWDGVIRSTGVLLAGKVLVIAGYGHCGRGIATRGRGMGGVVIITEVDPLRALQAKMDGFRVMRMIDAAKEGDIFITATGCNDVITSKHMVLMKDGAILANAGHFDVEINVDDTKKYNVRLLANGRLVNLVCAEGHPAEVMDLSFATQFMTTLWLAENPHYIGRVTADEFKLNRLMEVENVPEEVVHQVITRKLKSYNIKIDVLTDVQQAYLGVGIK